MWRILLTLVGLAVAVPAWADPLRDATRACRIERLDQAYANCVDVLSDRRELLIEAAIGQTLSGLQAATGSELRALADQYRAAQDRWAAAVQMGCGQAFPDRPRARADCRLQATMSRANQVTMSLERAADDLGGPESLGIDIPDAVEVFIPLPGVPNGPAQRIRVPLMVPVSP
ncbi:MAG: hypothetical protein AAGK00_02610 [Pseudomonadota bacterium]